jgi:hypothetical protein
MLMYCNYCTDYSLQKILRKDAQRSRTSQKALHYFKLDNPMKKIDFDDQKVKY